MSTPSTASPPRSVPRTALVTGGAGALGFAIAQQLAVDGRRLALIDTGEAVNKRAETLPGSTAIPCDIADVAALRASYRRAFEALGPLGVVVHAAGIAPVGPFLDTDRSLFDHVLTVNLNAAFSVFQLAARDLVAAGYGGRFVAIASISGSRAGWGRTAYGVAKAGLKHLMEQMALELGPYGITANTVSPGPVDTPLSRQAHTAEARADYLRTIPMQRYGTEADVAHAVAFFAADASGYVNGQTLFVDGGYMSSGMGVAMAQSAAAVRRKPVKSEPEV